MRGDPVGSEAAARLNGTLVRNRFEDTLRPYLDVMQERKSMPRGLAAVTSIE